MLPTVNGKPLFDCDESDLQQIIGNPDYRENEYLDYKATFSFLECDKGSPKREQLISEFRSDVCSFANTNGGYLVYGINDDRGMAKDLVGISIDNDDTDKFEQDRKNNLTVIMPKIPSVRFRFIHLENGRYLVILHVLHDAFAPYIHLQNEKDYRIYKRVNNGKSPMGYVELKNQFNQSLSLEKEVQRYREDRIFAYRSQEDNEEHWYSQFLLLHIVPDTFMDSSHSKELYIMTRKEPHIFDGIFESANCWIRPIPNVDGIRFVGGRTGEEGRLYNNGCAEVFLPLANELNFGYMSDKYPFGYLATTSVWERISPVISAYCHRMSIILDTKRIFVCLSIMGCKEVTTDSNWTPDYVGKIDRNTLMCKPITIDDVTNERILELSIKKLKIEYALGLGIRYSKTLNELIQEVYPSDYD